MAQFESQQKSLRNLVISPNRQTAYGTALADLSLTKRQRFDGAAMLEVPITRRTDRDQAGKGTQFATDGQITGFDSKIGLKFDLTAWLAGWLFGFAMGKEVVTGAASPYTHAITFDETTTQAPGTTLYMEDTADVHYKIMDMAMSELSLEIPARGAIKATADFLGTGHYTLGSMAALPALGAETYLLGSDCQFQMGPTGAQVSMGVRHLSSTIKVGTGVINHVGVGGGLYGQFMRTGLRTLSLQSVIAAKETDDIFTLFTNNTQSHLTWTINSGASAQLIIDMPAVNLKASKLGVDGNMIVWNIEADQDTMYGAGAQPLQVTVTNGVAAYLIAA